MAARLWADGEDNGPGTPDGSSRTLAAMTAGQAAQIAAKLEQAEQDVLKCSLELVGLTGLQGFAKSVGVVGGEDGGLDRERDEIVAGVAAGGDGSGKEFTPDLLGARASRTSSKVSPPEADLAGSWLPTSPSLHFSSASARSAAMGDMDRDEVDGDGVVEWTPVRAANVGKANTRDTMVFESLSASVVSDMGLAYAQGPPAHSRKPVVLPPVVPPRGAGAQSTGLVAVLAKTKADNARRSAAAYVRAQRELQHQVRLSAESSQLPPTVKERDAGAVAPATAGDGGVRLPPLRLRCITWNLNGKVPDESLRQLLRGGQQVAEQPLPSPFSPHGGSGAPAAAVVAAVVDERGSSVPGPGEGASDQDQQNTTGTQPVPAQGPEPEPEASTGAFPYNP